MSFYPALPDGLQDAHGAEPCDITGVFRQIEAHPHMRLSRQVVNLIRLHVVDQLDQVARSGYISVMQVQIDAVAIVRIAVDVVNALGVKSARPADQTVNLVTRSEEHTSEL